MVDIRGWRAQGNKVPNDKFKEIRWLEPLPVPLEEAAEPVAGELPDDENDGDETPEEATNALDENTVNPEEDDAEENGETGAEDEDTEEGPKSDVKPKKEGKKGSDPKSQLGLFE
jgi:topoisomerase IV subunit A